MWTFCFTAICHRFQKLFDKLGLSNGNLKPIMTLSLMFSCCVKNNEINKNRKKVTLKEKYVFLIYLDVQSLKTKLRHSSVNIHRRWILAMKTFGQILNKNTSPYFHRASLVVWLLTLLQQAILACYPFLDLQ